MQIIFPSFFSHPFSLYALAAEEYPLGYERQSRRKFQCWFIIYLSLGKLKNTLYNLSSFERPFGTGLAQLVKNPPAMQETLVLFLGWEDPLEEGMATHSTILAWRSPMDRGAWWAAVHGVTKSQTWLSNQAHILFF